MNVAGPMNVHPVNVNTRPAMIKTRGAFCEHVKREEEVDGGLLRYTAITAITLYLQSRCFVIL